jgi:hypothetical protein
MRIYVLPRLAKIKGGIEARCPELKIAGHGRDEIQALESLRRGIAAWCDGLRRAGRLEDAVRQRGLRLDSGGEDLAVVLAQPEGDVL